MPPMAVASGAHLLVARILQATETKVPRQQLQATGRDVFEKVAMPQAADFKQEAAGGASQLQLDEVPHVESSDSNPPLLSG